MGEFFRLIRAKHYIKNILIFLPLIFGYSLLNQDKLFSCILGFCTFCCASSIVYITNDIMDRERDRRHPTKRLRPIASGSVTVIQALVLTTILIIVVFLLLKITPGLSVLGGAMIPIYILINFIYSWKLKQIPIADVCILALGYILRVFFGSLITGIIISHWLYLTVLTLSFYLGLGKRRNELRGKSKGTREVLSRYTQSFLDKNMYLFLGLTLTFYALWSVDAATADYMVLTVPLVIIICMRYSLIIEGEELSDGDPVEVFLHDIPLVLMAVFYVAVVLGILYLPSLN